MASHQLKEKLLSYIPDIILGQAKYEPSVLSQPKKQIQECVFLSIDVLGLNDFTDDFIKQGPQSVDELNRLLDRYLGKLVEWIEYYNGDIIKCSPNRVLVLWRVAEDRAVVKRMVLQAAQCALSVTKQWNSFLSSDAEKLELRAQLAVGALDIMWVGGHQGHWQPIFSGHQVEQQIAKARAITKASELTISEKTWLLLDQDDGKVKRLEQGVYLLLNLTGVISHGRWQRLELDDAALNRLISYLPWDLKNHFDLSKDDLFIGIRRATVVVIKSKHLVVGSPIEEIQYFVKTLQIKLEKFQGVCKELKIDNTGLTAITVFGLPPLPHEEDSLMSVQFSLDLKSVFRKKNYSLAIGIVRGLIYCGCVGRGQRKFYLTLGKHIGFAEQLQQHTDNSILCDEYTYQATKTTVIYGTPVNIYLDSRTSIYAYRPDSLNAHQQKSKLDLIGRDIELKSIKQAIARLEDSKARQLLMVQGEAGMGKSTLREFTIEWISSNSSAYYILGQAQAIEKDTLYYPWKVVFDKIFSLSIEDSNDTKLKKINAYYHGQLDIIDKIPLLASLLDIDISENDFTQQLPSEVRSVNTRALLIEALKVKAKEQSLVIILDDVHWFDSNSLQLLKAVYEQIDNVLLILFMRPPGESAPKVIKELLFQPDVIQLILAPLTLEQTKSLVAQSLGVDDIPAQAASLIYKQSEGHPFFSQEIGYALRDAGVLLIDQNNSYLAALPNSLEIPETIEAVITSRVDRLDSDQSKVLYIASIIGREFTLEQIYFCADNTLSLEQISQACVHLDHQDLIVLQNSAHQRTYQFKHIITQEVVYSLVGFSGQKHTHHKIALWYESSLGEDVARYSGLLAYHWDRSQVIDKALYYLDKAANQALAEYSNVEAINFIQRAKELAQGIHKDSVMNIARERILGEAYAGLGNYDDASRHLEFALQEAGFSIPESVFAISRGIFHQILIQLAHRIKPVATPPKEQDLPFLLDVAHIFRALFLIYYFKSYKLKLIYCTLASANVAEKLVVANSVLPISYSALTAIIGAIPWHSQARHYGQMAQKSVAQTNHVMAEILVCMGVGAYENGIGAWSNALEKLKRGQMTAARIGDRRRWEEVSLNLAQQYAMKGDYKAAATVLDQVILSASKRNDLQIQDWALGAKMHFVLPLIGEEELLTGILQSKRVHKMRKQRNEPNSLLDYSIHCTVEALLQADNHTASQCIEQGISVLKQIGRPVQYFLTIPLATLTELSMVVWQEDVLNKRNTQSHQPLAQQTLNYLKAYSRVFPVGLAWSYFCQGLYYFTLGDFKRVQKAWQYSADWADHYNLQFISVRIHYLVKQLQEKKAISIKLDSSLDTGYQNYNEQGLKGFYFRLL